MNTSSASAAAHNPTVVCVPREVAEARQRIKAVVDLCLGSMSQRTSRSGLSDADTIWPTEVLDVLGIDYGPGSELASRPEEE
jgi:hypothetical protein